MRTEYETLKLDRVEDHILMVTLNRPERANAMNTQMGLDLRDLWQDIYTDQDNVRCIIMTGSGEKAFCAGGDLKDRDGMTDAQWQHQHAIFEQAVLAMMDVPPPIIGAINGVAYGGGTELALLTDFAYGASHARFALTEVTLGIMPGACATQMLPRAVGIRRAKEFLLAGAPCSAEEACEWGILNKVCDAESLMDEAMATARKICANAPISIRQAKKSLNMAMHVDARNGYMFEIEAYNRMVPTADRLEGIRAFNEKRKPVYKGE